MSPRVSRVAVAIAIAAAALAGALLPPPITAPTLPRAFTGLTVDAEPDAQQIVSAIVLSVELSYLDLLSQQLGLPRDEAVLARASGELLSSFCVQPQTAHALSRYLVELLAATLSRCQSQPDAELELAYRFAAAAAANLRAVTARANESLQPCRNGGAALLSSASTCYCWLYTKR